MRTPDFLLHEMEVSGPPTVTESFPTKVLRFVSQVIQGASRGVPIDPKSGYAYGNVPPPAASDIGVTEPAPAGVAAVQAPEAAKAMLGTVLANAGVTVQPKFLKILEGVQVGFGKYGKAGAYTSQAGIGLPALASAEPVTYAFSPNTSQPNYAARSGWVFLHECLHRFDEVLPEKKKQKIWAAVLEHFDEISPGAAAWLRQTRAGKNLKRSPPEALADALTNYLFYHDQWGEEMDALMDDYFKFE